jgi:hypothetical protein
MKGGVVSSPVKGTSFLLGRKTGERRPLETNKIEKGQRKTYRGKKEELKNTKMKKRGGSRRVGWGGGLVDRKEE